MRDGRVLIAGGSADTGDAVRDVQMFDPITWTFQTLPGQLLDARQRHTATLLPDGRVRFDGGIRSGQGRQIESEIFDPGLQTSQPATRPEPEWEEATLVAAAPQDGAQDVPADVRLSLQFAKPVTVESLQRGTVRLDGPLGEVPVESVLAEGGRLLFVTPGVRLSLGGPYALVVDRLVDTSGVWVPPVLLSFEVGATQDVSDPEAEEWLPNEGWETGRPPSPWQSLPSLSAASGVTALAGQVLRLNGRPLADVDVRIGDVTRRTDSSGRFLLAGVAAGRQELVVDARPASSPGRGFVYGMFMIAVDVHDGRTTALPYTIWLPVLDVQHAVTLPSPTPNDFVARTPRIRDLEIHIPRGAVLRDADGEVVRSMTITPIPIDRPPFPHRRLPLRRERPLRKVTDAKGGVTEFTHDTSTAS